jgi:hypothetical protein
VVRLATLTTYRHDRSPAIEHIDSVDFAFPRCSYVQCARAVCDEWLARAGSGTWQDKENVMSSQSSQDREGNETPWTKEEMEGAEPYPLPELPGSERGTEDDSTDAPELGEEQSEAEPGAGLEPGGHPEVRRD